MADLASSSSADSSSESETDEQVPTPSPTQSQPGKEKGILGFFSVVDKSNPADRARIEATKARESQQRKQENERRQLQEDKQRIEEGKKSRQKTADRKKRWRDGKRQAEKDALARQAERETPVEMQLEPPADALAKPSRKRAAADTADPEEQPARRRGRPPGSKNKSHLDKEARIVPVPRQKTNEVCNHIPQQRASQ